MVLRQGQLIAHQAQFYGWLDPAKGYLVSQSPADAPVRPAIVFSTLAEAVAFAERKKAKIMWWPPLPNRTAL